VAAGLLAARTGFPIRRLGARNDWRTCTVCACCGGLTRSVRC
jgi:hypothetical protein